jgi:DNA-binding ferritin-like protein
MEEKKSYEVRLEEQLKQLAANIDKLAERVGKTGGELRVKYNEQVEELKKNMSSANVKFTELKGTSGDAWAELKIGFENAFTALKEAFKNASAKINTESPAQGKGSETATEEKVPE